jgi:glycosyltransferase involved in cell wall biosynthesis
MSDNSIVSIIMIFLNAADFLQEAVESVLAQTYEHWELFLVDDGSTDRSTEIARQYSGQFPEKIRYLEHSGHKNLGMSHSRNLGIRHARGQYIAFLDADDIWLPRKLEYQIQIMASQPAAGMLYGNTLYWCSWTGRDEDRQRDHIPALRIKPNTLVEPPRLLQLYLSGKSAVPCTCSIMVRSEAVKRIGGFEESFRGMYEDQAFYAKMCLAEPIFVSDTCLDRYRQHPDSNSSVTEASGESRIVRLNFLFWLTDYLSQNHFEDPQLWLTLRQELWLSSQFTRIPLSEGSYAVIRWMKKWILRVAKRLLPTSLHLWIWTRGSYR